jgi:hypothetical protein
MQRHISVTLVSVTEVDDGLGNITEGTSEATYDRVRFAPRSSSESSDAATPRVITAAALYRRGEFPADLADRIVIAGQHATIDGTWQVEGDPGRWATGVEVAIKRVD